MPNGDQGAPLGQIGGPPECQGIPTPDCDEGGAPPAPACSCWATIASALGYSNVSTVQELWAAARPSGGCGFIDSCHEFSHNVSATSGSHRSVAGCYTQSGLIDAFETRVSYSTVNGNQGYGCTYSEHIGGVAIQGFISLEPDFGGEYTACIAEHDAFTSTTGPLPSPPEEFLPVTEIDDTDPACGL
jgi:hypothetical protein